MHRKLLLPLALLMACQTAPAKDSAPAPTASRAAPRKGLPKPEHISEDVRDAIASKMREHGDDMTVMLWSILFLDLQGSGEYARAMAARPPIPDTVDGHEVPKPILELQHELRARAEILATMAAAAGEESPAATRDPRKFAEAFGELTRVCVACHAAYLYPGRANEK